MFCYCYTTKIICVNKNDSKIKFKINVHPKIKILKGGAIWGGIAYDEKLNNIYVVTGNPRPALVGIKKRDNESQIVL